jgi:protein required for attachment to host cells
MQMERETSPGDIVSIVTRCDHADGMASSTATDCAERNVPASALTEIKAFNSAPVDKQPGADIRRKEIKMIIANDTTVAVADGRKLRLFRNKGIEPHIRLAVLDAPDIVAANRGSGVRHRSVSANPDDARLEEDDFAAQAASYLNREAIAGNIRSLYVIADPRTLGEMRRHFHEAITSRLVGELAKDLTGHAVDAIEAALAKA